MNQHHRHHLAQIYKTEVSTSFRTVSHEGTFPFLWCLMVLYYLRHEPWTMWLQCRAQEYSEHHDTFMHILYIYIIQNVLSIFWLAVMWAHWKTPAHGSEVMPARDSVWIVRWRRTWRNCALGQTSGQSGAELLAPWKYFMIVKAMEDKDRAHRGRKFWCWSEFCSFKQTKGIKRLTVEGQKRFVHRHCFGTP